MTQAVVGINSVRTALRFGRGGVTRLWLDRQRRDRRLAELVQLAHAAGIETEQVTRAALDEAAGGANHQGVLAWVQTPAARDEGALADILAPWCAADRASALAPPLLLLLDGVTDPHNLGACLRSADAAGVQAVIAPKDQAAGLTPVAVKVASGAAETVPFVAVTNLARTMAWLQAQGLWLIGTAGEAATPLFATDLRGPVALVLGSEGQGLRRLTRERCDTLVHLPMYGAVESLNVAVTAGICLYEALRQRRFAGPA
ncbi:MAG: 23S rRNA (guanosine(2251)-2'-O)-methyltransferase RlmB [Chromatiaceae bacterium]|nr:MAG: 23S rRNA (guanosine(2251)-2'-O)-methyltransferase RlmB [Chromatiaceae bacterium]